MHLTNKKFNQYTLICFGLSVLMFLIFAMLVPGVEGVQWVNGWNNPSLDIVFAGITNLGDGIFLALFVVLLLFFRFYLSMALLANGILQALVVSLFKRLLFPNALRPVAFLDAATVHFVNGVNVHRFMSFPSGHTISAFGLCMFLALCTRNRLVTILLLIISVLVAISRVYLLQHFVMDVAMGAMIGSLIGVGSHYYFERLTKPQWMMQRLEFKWRKSNPNPKPKFS